MTNDRPHDAGAEAEAERTAEVGWEPPDWPACLRRQRRRQLAAVIGLVVLVGVVWPVLQFAVRDRPPSLTYWVWVFITLIFVAETAISFVSATDRARWERETRHKVRIWHALRHHVGIGVADRALVTERAKEMATWSKVAIVGWPLLGVVFVAGVHEDEVPAPLAVPLVLLCLLLVGRAARRARLARRWLADPLPRRETPWT